MAEERGRRSRRSARVAVSSGAASHGTTGWHQIDWCDAERNVRRLQARIVKATQERRWNRVAALQHLLTRSFSGKALAVRRVTGNRGKRTPGVDGATWPLPAQKIKAVHDLKQRGYRPQPLRRVYIDKRGTTAKRPLGIPVMRDRAMQALYLLALNPVAETTGDESSYGFRPERSTADAIEKCFALIATRTSARWVLEGDIASCFDRISHDWLLEHVPMETTVLRKWLKAGFMDRSVLYPTEDGTPQGGVISPVLANLALDGLQRTLRDAFSPRYGQPSLRVHMVRYADDFIITGSSKELLEDHVRPVVEDFLRERGLELSPHKTVVTYIETGFDFLGQTVRKYGGTLLIMPSKKRVHSFLREVRKVIRKHHGAPAVGLIARLNPMLRGWANYHRHAVSSATYKDVDHQVWKAVWQWARRQHPNKGAKWLWAKYFPTVDGRRWVFTARDVNVKGEKRDVAIFLVTTVRIRRHIRIRGAANPFDPAWSDYFDARCKRAQKNADRDRQRRRSVRSAGSAAPALFIDYGREVAPRPPGRRAVREA